MISWLLSTAWGQAAPVVDVDLTANAAFGVVGDSSRRGFGEIGVSGQIAGPFRLGLGLRAGVTDRASATGGGVPALGAVGRVEYRAPVAQDALRLSLLGGVDWTDALRGVAGARVGWEARVSRGLWARVGAGGEAGFAPGRPAGFSLSLGAGVVWGPVRDPVVPVEPAPSLSSLPEGAMVLSPSPRCEAVPAAEAGPMLAAMGADDPVRVFAPGYRPATARAGDLQELSLERSPGRGAIVLAVFPGDVVRVDGVALPTGRDAVAPQVSAEGDHGFEVIGGGRRDTIDVGVVDGYGTWVRARTPQDVRLRFTVGSAELTAGDQEVVARIAPWTGGWMWTVIGSWSPEGDPAANRALALNRERAVIGALVAAGVDPSAIVVGEPMPPDPGLAVEDQRAVVLRPTAPRVSP